VSPPQRATTVHAPTRWGAFVVTDHTPFVPTVALAVEVAKPAWLTLTVTDDPA
jgi:hypothetical protein